MNDITVLPAGAEVNATPAVRDAIGRLMMAYAHAIDNDEIERWPTFFTPDALYRIIPRTEYEQGRPIGIWQCDNRGMMEDRVSAYRSVNVYEPHVYRHVIGPTELLGVTGELWRTQTSFIVVRTMHDGTMTVFSAGRYVDEILIDGDTARFRSRNVITDSARYDTLVVIPL